MRALGVLSNAFSLNSSARQGACKRSRFKSIGLSPENRRWLPKQYWVFARDYIYIIRRSSHTWLLCDYARNIFRFDFRNDDGCFCVWIYEMEQFKLKVGRCFTLVSNQWGDLICVLLGRSQFLLSERSLSFNIVMITQTSTRWSARIVGLASDWMKYICIEHLQTRVQQCESLSSFVMC